MAEKARIFSRRIRGNLLITIFIVSTILLLVQSIWAWYASSASDLPISHASIVYHLISTVILGVLTFEQSGGLLFAADQRRVLLVQSVGLTALSEVLVPLVQTVWIWPPLIQGFLYFQAALAVPNTVLAVMLAFPPTTTVGSLFYANK